MTDAATTTTTTFPSVAGSGGPGKEPKPNGKANRFRKQAEKRVVKALSLIRKVGDLSNRALYDYHPDQVVKVFEAMRDELDAAESRFGQRGSPPPAFSLDS